MPRSYPNSVTTVVTIPGTGIHSLGISQTGSANIMLEGLVSGTLGYMSTAHVFTPYTNGAVAENSSTVVDCGAMVPLAIDATGSGTIRVASI